jgi:hypothetical protein
VVHQLHYCLLSTSSHRMATSEYLKLINTSCASNRNLLFHPFLALLTEIRLRIWKFSIERHRLLEIEVEGHVSPSDSGITRYSTKNKFDKLTSGHHYTVKPQGDLSYSQILHVNSESRQVALKFYHIHIPCQSYPIADRCAGEALYINPEFDIILLKVPDHSGETFVDFFTT